MCLLLKLVICRGGSYLVEQPSSSVLRWYPRMASLGLHNVDAWHNGSVWVSSQRECSGVFNPSVFWGCRSYISIGIAPNVKVIGFCSSAWAFIKYNCNIPTAFSSRMQGVTVCCEGFLSIGLHNYRRMERMSQVFIIRVSLSFLNSL